MTTINAFYERHLFAWTYFQLILRQGVVCVHVAKNILKKCMFLKTA